MTSIDDRIKTALEQDTKEIDALLAKEGGLPDMISASFKGGLRRWMFLVWPLTLIVTGFMVWSIYNFFTAGESYIYWGFCSVGLMMMQIALKQWSWMEMNRASMAREIKRLELVIAGLSAKLDKNS